MITRTYSPFRSFDRTFDEIVAAALGRPEARAPAFAFDAAWKDGNLVIAVDLPGVPDDSIKVAVADRVLTVAVTRTVAGPNGDSTSTEERSVRLGNALDPSGVSAVYRFGRLTITVPAAAKPEPRVVPIAVSTAPETHAVEAESTVIEPSAVTAPEAASEETA